MEMWMLPTVVPSYAHLLPSALKKCTLKEALAAPYSFSKLSTNFCRASSATSTCLTLMASWRRVCIAKTNKKMIPTLPFQNALNNKNDLHSDAFQNVLSFTDLGALVTSTGGLMASNSWSISLTLPVPVFIMVLTV